MTTREINWINNFWKVLAAQPELLKRTWDGAKSVMAPGIVSIANQTNALADGFQIEVDEAFRHGGRET